MPPICDLCQLAIVNLLTDLDIQRLKKLSHKPLANRYRTTLGISHYFNFRYYACSIPIR